jgi:hypothetical protein
MRQKYIKYNKNGTRDIKFSWIPTNQQSHLQLSHFFHLHPPKRIYIHKMVHTLPFQSIQVPTPGFGAMGLSHGLGSNLSLEQASPVLLKALELGCTFWDTAVIYNAGINEKLLGDFIRKYDCRDKIFRTSPSPTVPRMKRTITNKYRQWRPNAAFDASTTSPAFPTPQRTSSPTSKAPSSAWASHLIYTTCTASIQRRR